MVDYGQDIVSVVFFGNHMVDAVQEGSEKGGVGLNQETLARKQWGPRQK